MQQRTKQLSEELLQLQQAPQDVRDLAHDREEVSILPTRHLKYSPPAHWHNNS